MLKAMERRILAAMLLGAGFPIHTGAAGAVIDARNPVTPPAWALLEREVLRAGSDAVASFYDRYFDERGYLLHVARWGILDGTDDAIETFHNWTLFHALGADDLVLDRYRKALEGHLRQYSAVTTTTTDIAAGGVYHREFYRHTDWLHAGEGLRSFFFQGLADPANKRYVERMRRFAGLYMNEDGEAQNYDPKHRIIRSVLNGSRGPLLRKLTANDWIGDPVPGRFHLLHSGQGDKKMLDFEAEYPSMLAAVSDPVFESAAGDNPLNLAATNLATCAYLLTGEKKYRDWVLEYVGAWRERTAANGGIIPGNVGMDGVTGSAYGGKWYKGIFMWDRERYEGSLASWGMWPGFGNALLLTGDMSWADTLRRQIDLLYAQGRQVNGRFMTPNNYGDGGWYRLREYTFTNELAKIWTWTMDPKDRDRLPQEGWIAFLAGKNSGYPETALRRELEFIRQRTERARHDPTTPDSRLADWALQHNPVTTRALVELTGGGHRIDNALDRLFGLLHCRVRYFDPERRRAGLPADVAALVTAMDAGRVQLTLVNTSQVEERAVIVQGGAYGEHQLLDVTADGRTTKVDGPSFTVRMAPGAGAELAIRDRRYANLPTMAMPWQGSARKRPPMPKVTKPVLFGTVEADRILTALQVFPPDNPWNQDVSGLPVHANSAQIIGSIGAEKHLGYNLDMNFVIVPPNQKRIPVKILKYPADSDPGPFPVPENAPIENWPLARNEDTGALPRAGQPLDDIQRHGTGDRHLLIVDPGNGKLHEFWQARRTDAGWEASNAATFDLRTGALRPEGWTSADAAGLPIFPASVRYDECERGLVEHAMRVTVRRTQRAYVLPATHFASRFTDPNLPRMGERLRLRRDFNTSGFPPHARAILDGLKKYGMFVADNGQDWLMSISPDARLKGLETLEQVKGSDFEVVETGARSGSLKPSAN